MSIKFTITGYYTKGEYFSVTLKPVYLEHVDKWFLKIYSLKLHRTNFKNQLSTCST